MSKIMTKHKIDWRIGVAAIFGIVVMECFAMSQGINGIMLRIATMVIAGIVGITIPNPFKTN